MGLLDKIQAIFNQIDTNKDKKISAQELKASSYASIFNDFPQNSVGVDISVFSNILISHPEALEKLSLEDSNSGQIASANTQEQPEAKTQIPFSPKDSVKLDSIPKVPEQFEWHIWWGKEGQDLRGNDASGLDLSEQKDLLEKSNFDSNTKFPPKDKMPDGFNPKQLLEDGKNPGLGIRKLNTDGYTGKGVNVAIIDLPMSANHSEFKDNIVNYTETGVDPNSESEMHGFATTSILAGKTSGVAPDAKVSFYAFNPTEKDDNTGGVKLTNKFVTQSLDKIYEANKKLSPSEQINAVSLSWGPDMSAADYNEFKNSVKKLEDSGVFVQYSDNDSPDAKLKFDGLTRDNLKNPDDINSYKLSDVYENGGDSLADKTRGNTLLIPAGHRTTAAPTAKDDYVNYAQGGVSWQIPYIVGVYSLAKQANPSLTPDEFRKISMETGTPYYTQSGKLAGKIINPEKIIEVSKKNTY